MSQQVQLNKPKHTPIQFGFKTLNFSDIDIKKLFNLKQILYDQQRISSNGLWIKIKVLNKITKIKKYEKIMYLHIFCYETLKYQFRSKQNQQYKFYIENQQNISQFLIEVYIYPKNIFSKSYEECQLFIGSCDIIFKFNNQNYQRTLSNIKIPSFKSQNLSNKFSQYKLNISEQILKRQNIDFKQTSLIQLYIKPISFESNYNKINQAQKILKPLLRVRSSQVLTFRSSQENIPVNSCIQNNNVQKTKSKRLKIPKFDELLAYRIKRQPLGKVVQQRKHYQNQNQDSSVSINLRLNNTTITNQQQKSCLTNSTKKSSNIRQQAQQMLKQISRLKNSNKIYPITSPNLNNYQTSPIDMLSRSKSASLLSFSPLKQCPQSSEFLVIDQYSMKNMKDNKKQQIYVVHKKISEQQLRRIQKKFQSYQSINRNNINNYMNFPRNYKNNYQYNEYIK